MIMKVSVPKSLVLLLGLASSLLGDEPPGGLGHQAPDVVPVDHPAVLGEAAELPKAEPIPWIGVGSEVADEALAAQLGIEGGMVVRLVIEGSPAAEAGLKVHDVIESVDGGVLLDRDALRAVVLQHEAGDVILLNVVRGGEKREVKVTLADRPDDFARWADRIEQLLGDEPFKMIDLLKAGKVALFDDEGSVQKEISDESIEVEVRNKDGDLLYKGPWNDEKDKAAVDPEVRKRIELLNFNDGAGGLQFYFDGEELLPEGEAGGPEVNPEKAPVEGEK